MKINTMKLKLTALLLVLYTGLYAQNKIVLTAPRLDTSSLSNRINLKANTNLNNVNGVLSSTYGGAGIINGILKADGSGVVSAATASDIPSLSAYYLPLSGGTLTGALSGPSGTFSGRVTANDFRSTSGTIETFVSYSGSNGAIGTATNHDLQLFTNGVARVTLNSTALTSTVPINGTSLSMSGGVQANSANVSMGADGSFGGYSTLGFGGLSNGSNRIYAGNSGSDGMYIASATSRGITFRTNGGTSDDVYIAPSGNLLVNTTTDNGTDALQVAGSGLFTGNLNASNFQITARSSSNALQFPDWRVYNTSGNNFAINNYTTDVFSISSTGAATFSSSVTAKAPSGSSDVFKFSSASSASGNGVLYSYSDGNGVQNGIGSNISITSGGSISRPNTSLSAWYLAMDNRSSPSFTVNYVNPSGTISTPLSIASTGAITASSSVTASSFFESSDLRKKDVVSVTKQADGIDFIGFKWKKELNLDNRKHLGVIAQQVEKVIPDAVTTDEKGFKSVNYTEVMLYKLEKLTEKVSELEKELKKLKTKKLKN